MTCPSFKLTKEREKLKIRLCGEKDWRIQILIEQRIACINIVLSDLGYEGRWRWRWSQSDSPCQCL